MSTRSFIVHTIGDLIDNALTMAGICGDCNHHFNIDLSELAERFGRECIHLDQAALRIPCKRCGSNKVSRLVGK